MDKQLFSKEYENVNKEIAKKEANIIILPLYEEQDIYVNINNDIKDIFKKK